MDYYHYDYQVYYYYEYYWDLVHGAFLLGIVTGATLFGIMAVYRIKRRLRTRVKTLVDTITLTGSNGMSISFNDACNMLGINSGIVGPAAWIIPLVLIGNPLLMALIYPYAKLDPERALEIQGFVNIALGWLFGLAIGGVLSYFAARSWLKGRVRRSIYELFMNKSLSARSSDGKELTAHEIAEALEV